MGSASLIATAIALILLIVTAYVVVGGILATSEIVSLSQAERFSFQETRLHTSVDISEITVFNETHALNITVENSGRVPISEFKYMDIYMIYQGNEPILVPYSETSGTDNTWYAAGISPDTVHPNELDPGESLSMTVTYTPGVPPLWIKIATPNGVYDSAYIPT